MYNKKISILRLRTKKRQIDTLVFVSTVSVFYAIIYAFDILIRIRVLNY